MIQFYDALLARLGVTEFELRAELDRRRRLPAGLRRAAERVARRARRRARRRRRASKRATSPLRVFDVKDRSGARGARRTRRRSATRSATRCREHFAQVVRATSTPTACAYDLDPDARARPRLLHAHDLGVRRPRGGRRTRRSAAAAATTACRGRSAARRRPGIGFGAGLERLLLALEDAGVEAEREPARRLLRRRAAGAGRAACSRAGGAARAPGSRPTPTTPAARSRASSPRAAAAPAAVIVGEAAEAAAPLATRGRRESTARSTSSWLRSAP